MMNVKPFYPGFVRKAITFSIDDGNLETDEKLLYYARPAGIKGTFNLCGHSMDRLSPAAYRSFYAGYEIANHCKYHPFAFEDGMNYPIQSALFDEAAADPGLIYPTEVPGLYMVHTPRGWRRITDAANYIRFMNESREELENVFGKGSIHGFVWPFHPPKCEALLRYAADADYEYVRAVYPHGEGSLRHFDLPENWKNWVYTAAHDSLTSFSQEYADYPDDGTLKFFCFGVHSADYERYSQWDAMEVFCRDFGSQPEKYWYAANYEIYCYAAAMKTLRVENGVPVNGSSIPLYVSVDGEKTVLPPMVQ